MRKSRPPAGFVPKPLLGALPLSEGSADIFFYISYHDANHDLMVEITAFLASWLCLVTEIWAGNAVVHAVRFVRARDSPVILLGDLNARHFGEIRGFGHPSLTRGPKGQHSEIKKRFQVLRTKKISLKPFRWKPIHWGSREQPSTQKLSSVNFAKSKTTV